MSDDSQDLEIERSDRASGGVYRLNLEGSVAEMTFSRTGAHLVIIDHTEVPAALRGRRIGERLVARAVGDARAQDFKIFPLCPFAAAQFRKHQEYHDVLSR